MNKRHQKIVGNTIILAFIIAGLLWVCGKFIHMGSSTFTDNAQVCQHIVAVTAKVPGFVKEVRVEDYTHVRRGDTLLILEDTEFRLQVAQAEAGYQNALTNRTAQGTSIQTTENNIAVSDAAMEELSTTMRMAETNYHRYQKLLASEAVTRQEYDAVETHYLAMKAKYETMRRQQQTQRLVKSEQTQRLDQSEAAIEAARAALELARVNLSRTVVLAPCDGYTSRVDIQVGELVQPGRTLLSVVDDREHWVVANYRETQLRNIVLGKKVKITVDALPDKEYVGTVTAISAATGAQYALVPQDNSAGNFVKVEQRVPVKIVFDDANSREDMLLLRSGLNVECELK